MALVTHGPGTPLFISPNFSHVQPSLVDAPYTASPVLYALAAVLIVVLLAGTAAVARWATRRGRTTATPTDSPRTPQAVAEV